MPCPINTYDPRTFGDKEPAQIFEAFEDEEKVLAAVALHEAKMNNLKNASPAKTPME